MRIIRILLLRRKLIHSSFMIDLPVLFSNFSNLIFLHAIAQPKPSRKIETALPYFSLVWNWTRICPIYSHLLSQTGGISGIRDDKCRKIYLQEKSFRPTKTSIKVHKMNLIRRIVGKSFFYLILKSIKASHYPLNPWMCNCNELQ